MQILVPERAEILHRDRVFNTTRIMTWRFARRHWTTNWCAGFLAKSTAPRDKKNNENSQGSKKILRSTSCFMGLTFVIVWKPRHLRKTRDMLIVIVRQTYIDVQRHCSGENRFHLQHLGVYNVKKGLWVTVADPPMGGPGGRPPPLTQT